MSTGVAVVTGATSGLGEATATGLAAHGYTVAVIGRDEHRTETAATRITRAAGNGQAVPLAADLTVQSDVRRIASIVAARFDRIDVLVNNAGGGSTRFDRTVDGVERTVALNHLAPFLLTHDLLPRLRTAQAAHIVGLTSSSHRSARGAVVGDGRYSANAAYARSKLAVIHFTAELARRLVGTSMTSLAYDPGPVRTSVFSRPEMRGFGGVARPLLVRMHRLAGVDPARAAAPLVTLAMGTSTARPGETWGRNGPVRVSRRARDTSEQRSLWQLSRTTTGLDRSRPHGLVSAGRRCSVD